MADGGECLVYKLLVSVHSEVCITRDGHICFKLNLGLQMSSDNIHPLR